MTQNHLTPYVDGPLLKTAVLRFSYVEFPIIRFRSVDWTLLINIPTFLLVGRAGKAATFVSQYDLELYLRIEQLLGRKMPKYETEEEVVMTLGIFIHFCPSHYAY